MKTNKKFFRLKVFFVNLKKNYCITYDMLNYSILITVRLHYTIIKKLEINLNVFLF